MRVLVILILFYAHSSFGINPEREYRHFPKDFGIETFDEFYLRTSDDCKIKVWEFNPENERKQSVIIISNGDSGNMSYLLYYVSQLSELGYTVITYDYRGFGDSENFDTQSDYLYHDEFKYDLAEVLAYAKSKYGLRMKIGMMSFSMGTIISGLVLADERVDFFIAENLVVDPGLVRSRLDKLKNKHYQVPNQQSVDIQSILENLNCPILLFASQEDDITTIEDSITVIMKDVAQRVLVIYQGGHGKGLTSLTSEITGDIYMRKIENFLETKLKK